MANGRWRDLPPVERPVTIEPDEETGEKRVSQTFMRTHDRCDRSAYLDLLNEGGPGSHEMNRGSIFHRVAKKLTDLCIEEGENAPDPDTGKDVLREVYAESPELTVPHAERDALRGMVFNFCEGSHFIPENIIGVEQSFRLEVAGWVLRCKVDLVERVGYGRIDVTDYKTSFWITPTEEIESDYQGILYLMAIALGETDGGFSVAQGVEEFTFRQAFPRFLREYEGGVKELARTEPLVLTRTELLDRRLDLEDQIHRLELSLDTGKWPATPGPRQCAECVAPQECPLPRHLRPDSQMAIATPDDAAKLAEWWFVEKARVERAKRRLKEWSKQHGKPQIPIGNDQALAWIEREEGVSIDREKLILEAEGAAEYGHEFDTEKYLKKRLSTRFEPIKVSSVEEPHA